LLIAMAAAVIVFVLHEVMLARAVPELSAARDRIDTLNAELLSLTGRLERSEARLVVAEREAEVIRQANQLLREEESQRHKEITDLRGELEFYRRLAGSGGTQDGLAVYQVELEATDSDRVFHFVLTLTQNIRRASIITGRARIDIEGTLDDRPVTLYWSRITEKGTSEPEFRFKYFQQIEGYLALPPEFLPARLIVTLTARERREPVKRSFEWGALTAPGGKPVGRG
jgi:hypothetical protein